MQRTTTYREQSRIFLAQAHEELAKGDLQQASEKAWGAASQMVKAIAQERGWLHSSHRHLYGVINALESETSDSELTVLFASAGDLHINFYENRYSPNNIRHLLNQVEQFVDKAEGLLAATA